MSDPEYDQPTPMRYYVASAIGYLSTVVICVGTMAVVAWMIWRLGSQLATS